MTPRNPDGDSETLGSDFGEMELDAEELAQAQVNLDDPSAGDDEPWSPPDRQPRGAEFVDIEDETLDQRIRQEEPEVDSAYGDPDDADTRPREMAGGDDPDAIPAEDDILGGPAGEDTYLDGSGPESSAMRVVEDGDPE